MRETDIELKLVCFWLKIVLILASFLITVVALKIAFEDTEQDYSEPVVSKVVVQEEPVIKEEPVEEPEDYENEIIEEALILRSAEIKNAKITFYCCENYKHICNAGEPFLCADGTEPVPYVTCAADDIPLGATVMILDDDGNVVHYLRVTDRFGGKQKNHIDIAVATHSEALTLGVKHADIRWVIEE